jgi:dTDP-4-dehydrorhamnose reductase
MKVLVLGCNGQLGVALSETAPTDAEIVGFDLPELDITDASAVMDIVRGSDAAVIVNAAAYTAVDNAESDAEKCRAETVNGPENLAPAAKECGARLLHVSTDFVFDDESSVPYKTNDPTNPLSVSGQTKRDGELSIMSDRVGTPTWANWHDFALAIKQEAHALGPLDKMIPVRAITSADYPTAAARPKCSVLDCAVSRDVLDLCPADWRVNLKQMLEELRL